MPGRRAGAGLDGVIPSNFPVNHVSSYNMLYTAFKRVSKHYSTAKRAATFQDMAARVYRLDV
jgi:predicted TIM-barrel fold metal-dependent hydrolase